jgi:hypothetical protein
VSEPVIVRMSDVRAIKGCSRGARYFCETHGIDWTDFLANGVPAERLEETGDAMALRLTRYARQRAEAERGRR